MSTAPPIRLGAPGLYLAPRSQPPTLSAVQLDLCAFAGVAPRGPARVPVAGDEVDGRFWPGDVPYVEPERPRLRSVAVEVRSFDAYQRIFGGFEGPGRLPYAVAAYFENGGQRALVTRIVHNYGSGDPRNDAGVARSVLGGVQTTIGLTARNEGTWGADLTAALAFTTSPIDLTPQSGGLRLGPGARLSAGALLRATYPDGIQVLCFVSRLIEVPDGARPGHVTLALPDTALPAGAPRFELVEAELTLDDGDGRTEHHTGLGLAFGHPRWLAQVLCDASQLAWPEHDWARGEIRPSDARLIPPPLARFNAGTPADRWADIVPADFFDPGWSPDDGEPGNGICCLVPHRDSEGIGGLRPASLCVPDLYSPKPLAERQSILSPVTLAGPTFRPCVTITGSRAQGLAEDDLPGLHLDPIADLDTIIALQQRLIDFAESLADLVALIDIPPGLDPARVRRWRSALGSSYAAAYHPWLLVTRRDDDRDALIDLPPCAVAAGVIADRELAFGVHYGPANQIAARVVKALVQLSPELHGELHQAGVDCFMRERDGIRLTGARTLSRDPAYRQLSVRRLMIQLRRVLLAQMQWAVFEPNGPALWRTVRRLLTTYLRELYRHGAFRGATEAEAFFVRCDETLNPPYALDQGRMTAEVGVAPAEPLEFIVLRIDRAGDGTLTINEAQGNG